MNEELDQIDDVDDSPPPRKPTKRARLKGAAAQNHGAKYRDTTGRFRTVSLFLETIRPGQLATGHIPVFTLKHDDFTKDGVTYPSMKRLYLAMQDPTEHAFAMETFGSWGHWEKLLNTEWFVPFIVAWRAELDMHIRALGIKQMLAAAKMGDQSAIKWIATGGWKQRVGAGRPTKAEKEAVIREEAGLDASTRKDAERLGLRVVGGKDHTS